MISKFELAPPVSDLPCKFNPSQPIPLVFSICRLGEQFTCRSGQCVSSFSRCDNIYDCGDHSDEEDCLAIKVPSFYDKSKIFKNISKSFRFNSLSDQPPELDKEANPLNTTIEILSIDEIDTFNMEVGITFSVKIQWKDPRLTYSNILHEPFQDEVTFRVLGK